MCQSFSNVVTYEIDNVFSSILLYSIEKKTSKCSTPQYLEHDISLLDKSRDYGKLTSPFIIFVQ